MFSTHPPTDSNPIDDEWIMVESVEPVETVEKTLDDWVIVPEQPRGILSTNNRISNTTRILAAKQVMDKAAPDRSDVFWAFICWRSTASYDCAFNEWRRLSIEEWKRSEEIEHIERITGTTCIQKSNSSCHVTFALSTK
jgi:uncharacterized protein YbcC (UPF0753/DUF2309 family)